MDSVDNYLSLNTCEADHPGLSGTGLGAESLPEAGSLPEAWGIVCFTVPSTLALHFGVHCLVVVE